MQCFCNEAFLIVRSAETTKFNGKEVNMSLSTKEHYLKVVASKSNLKIIRYIWLWKTFEEEHRPTTLRKRITTSISELYETSNVVWKWNKRGWNWNIVKIWKIYGDGNVWSDAGGQEKHLRDDEHTENYNNCWSTGQSKRITLWTCDGHVLRANEDILRRVMAFEVDRK